MGIAVEEVCDIGCEKWTFKIRKNLKEWRLENVQPEIIIIIMCHL